jgi:hypothetical protein
MVVSRASKAVLAFAAVGLIVPIATLLIDHVSKGGWWPHWIMYAWPTSYMFGATSGVVDAFWYEIAAVAIALNVVIYAAVGGILLRLLGPSRPR